MVPKVGGTEMASSAVTNTLGIQKAKITQSHLANHPGTLL